MKTKNIMSMLMIALALSGCGAIIKYQFSSKEEQYAANQATWIPIGATKDGKYVYYDPFQMYWGTTSSLQVPIRYATEGEYGNWIYQMNCYNDQVTILRTLGGRQINRTVSVGSDNLLKIAKDRLCGINIRDKKYAYIGVDSKTRDFYYNTYSVMKNSKSPTIYKAEVSIYSQQSKSFEGSGEVEFNCADSTFKAATESGWKTPDKRSPANVLIYQFCTSPTLKNAVTKTYIGSSKGSDSVDMKDYMNRLDASSKRPSPTPSDSNAGKKQQGTGFDWNNLVIQPKN